MYKELWMQTSIWTDLVSLKEKLQSPEVVVGEGSAVSQGNSLLIKHLAVDANLNFLEEADVESLSV